MLYDLYTILLHFRIVEFKYLSRWFQFKPRSSDMQL